MSAVMSGGGHVGLTRGMEVEKWWSLFLDLSRGKQRVIVQSVRSIHNGCPTPTGSLQTGNVEKLQQEFLHVLCQIFSSLPLSSCLPRHTLHTQCMGTGVVFVFDSLSLGRHLR